MRASELTVLLLQWPLSYPVSKRSEKSFDLAYPALAQLRRNRKPALESIRKYSSNTDRSPGIIQHRRKLLQILQTFNNSSAKDSGLPTPKLHDKAFVQDDYNSSVRALYKVLSAYCICDNRRITAKLRLNVEKKDDDFSPAFGVLFLAHPHQEESECSSQWQNTRICVYRR